MIKKKRPEGYDRFNHHHHRIFVRRELIEYRLTVREMSVKIHLNEVIFLFCSKVKKKSFQAWNDLSRYIKERSSRKRKQTSECLLSSMKFVSPGRYNDLHIELLHILMHSISRLFLIISFPKKTCLIIIDFDIDLIECLRELSSICQNNLSHILVYYTLTIYWTWDRKKFIIGNIYRSWH